MTDFMDEHRIQTWQEFRWTRQPDTFLVRVCDQLRDHMWHVPHQGTYNFLNHWPDNEFVEDAARCADGRRMFREEWEMMRASNCIGNDEGLGDHVLHPWDQRDDDEDDEADHDEDLFSDSE